MRPIGNALGLIVGDMARAVVFYRVLGLEFPGDTDHQECELVPGFKLMLDTQEAVAAFSPGWEPPSGTSRASLAFQCAGPAEVDKIYVDLLAAGGTSEREPWDAFWGQRYASVVDPDGNAVDLYATL
jgi:uncharacterized glyoxalase superfamily protein PhnB